MSLALNTVVSDEEHRIVGLLEHAATFCDELVVVVDEHSSDGTYDLAFGFGAKTIIGPHSWFCEPLRPLAAHHTESDWILILDGDELLNTVHLPILLDPDRTWKAAQLPRISTVDGIPLHDQLDAQCRFFEKGAVEYGLNPHTRLVPKPGVPVFHPKSPGWIIHAKTQEEWEADLHREQENR